MSSDYPSPGEDPGHALLDLLAGLVSKPVLVTLSTPSSGPVAIVRGPLLRVEVLEDYGGVAYLHFAEEFHGTRLVLPIDGLVSRETDGKPVDRALLTYVHAEVELKDISPEAVVRHYRRIAREVLKLPLGDTRRAQIAVVIAMAETDVVRIDDPLLVAELRELIEVLERADGEPDARLPPE